MDSKTADSVGLSIFGCFAVAGLTLFFTGMTTCVSDDWQRMRDLEQLRYERGYEQVVDEGQIVWKLTGDKPESEQEQPND